MTEARVCEQLAKVVTWQRNVRESNSWPHGLQAQRQTPGHTLCCMSRTKLDVFLLLWVCVYKCKVGKGKKYSSSQTASLLQELTCHMGSHSVTCHPPEVTFLPLTKPIKAGTRFSDLGGMQGWVDLVGLVTYRGGIPARRWSPIPVLTVLNVE